MMRQHEFDLILPFFQGMTRIDGRQGYLNSEIHDLDVFRSHAMDWLKNPPKEQERRFLIWQAQQAIATTKEPPKVQAWLQEVAATTSLEDLFTALVKAPDARRLRFLLTHGGQHETLTFLQKRETLARSVLGQDYNYVLSMLTRSLRPPSQTETLPSKPEPSPEQLEQWRRDIQDHSKDSYYRFIDALNALSEHEPERVVSYLMSWENPHETYADADMGYRFGSIFAHRCPSARSKHYHLLLEAKDPFIRTAAAVYLRYLEETSGTEALQHLAENELSLAGTWAALTLARDGNPSHMHRLLTHLGTTNPDTASVAGVFHGLLQRRTWILLSNSCHASDVPLPTHLYGDKAPAHYLDWWEKHQDALRLSDPWLPQFRAQHVD